MKRSGALRSSLVGALGMTVSCLLVWLLVSPYIDRSDAAGQSRDWLRPASDVPSLAGYRSVWADNRPAVRRVLPTDRLLEIVRSASQPFAPHFADPLIEAAFMTRRSRAALIVRLDSDVPLPATQTIPYVDDANATVEQVVFDHYKTPMRPGDAMAVHVYRGTKVIQVGATRVVERVEYARAPRAGQRYLVFLPPQTQGVQPLVSFGYGNAFEIRGRRLVNMTMPDQSAWRLSASLDRVLSLVRRRAEALPRPPSSDVELIEDLLR